MTRLPLPNKELVLFFFFVSHRGSTHEAYVTNIDRPLFFPFPLTAVKIIKTANNYSYLREQQVYQFFFRLPDLYRSLRSRNMGGFCSTRASIMPTPLALGIRGLRH